jgi:hypothetical protein
LFPSRKETVSMPTASDRLLEQTKSFTPPPGHVGVYVIRRVRRLADQALWTVVLDFPRILNSGK